MVAFTHILCPIDFSDASIRALSHAAALSRWYEARLTVLHVVPTFESAHVLDPLGIQVQLVNPISREAVVDELKRAVARAGAPAGTTVKAAAGDTAVTIVDRALSSRADLIVMGTHGLRGFRRLLLGSVTEAVASHAPCPVFTVPPLSGALPGEPVTFEHILCPVDFSPSALQALGFAMDLARQADGRVTLLHVVEWLAEDEPKAAAHFNVPEYRRALAGEAADRLQALVAGEPHTRIDVESSIVFGRAHREILRAAEAGPVDLIVMGAQGRGRVGLLLFGSTAQQVVRAAACPVMTVRGQSVSGGASSATAPRTRRPS